MLNLGGGGGGGRGRGGGVFAIIVIHRDDGIAQQLYLLWLVMLTACNSIIPILIVTLYCSSIQSSRVVHACAGRCLS